MRKNRLPYALELDDDSFQEVMNAQHEPLVVLVATPNQDMTANAQKVKDIARQWKNSKGDAGVVFAWMDTDRWASWLKNMYGVPSDGLTHVVIADHAVSLSIVELPFSDSSAKRLIYYDHDQIGEDIQLTATSIFSTVTGVLNHTVSAKHSENIIERLARVCV